MDNLLDDRFIISILVLLILQLRVYRYRFPNQIKITYKFKANIHD